MYLVNNMIKKFLTILQDKKSDIFILCVCWCGEQYPLSPQVSSPVSD